MKTNIITEFREKREEQNKRIFNENFLPINRFFALDTRAYETGALDEKTKELMGLVASLVLRCDDCVSYHIDKAISKGANRDELNETLNIGLIVGGSIVIPHLRRAYAAIDAAFSETLSQEEINELR